MVLIQYLKYFISSIQNRGFTYTCKLIWSETKWERKFGIKTLSIENLENKTLASGKIEDTHHYQGASYYILHQVFSKLNANTNLGFIDYGCGKGRALFVAAHYGFNPCIGVDSAKELCDDANENIQKTKGKFPHTTFQIVFENAINYIIPESISVFYFFNPFPAHVMEAVRDNVISFSKTNSKTIKIIYVNPKFESVFAIEGFTKDFEIRSKNYAEAIVYTYTPNTIDS